MTRKVGGYHSWLMAIQRGQLETQETFGSQKGTLHVMAHTEAC